MQDLRTKNLTDRKSVYPPDTGEYTLFLLISLILYMLWQRDRSRTFIFSAL